MKRLRKLLGLTLALLIGVSGCTWLAELPLAPTPTVPPIPATVPSPIVTPVMTPSPSPGAPSQSIVLELWVPEFLSPDVDGAVAETIGAQLDAFEAGYRARGLQVHTTTKKGTGQGGIYNLLTTAAEVAPAVLPDLLVLNQHDLLLAANEGLLQPLEGELPVNGDYYTATLGAIRNTAGVWAFPYLARADQMVYREGITDTSPLTWSSVLSGSYEVLLPAASPDGLAGDALLQIYLGSGGRVMDSSGQASLDRASLERTYGFLLDLQSAGLLNAEQLLDLPNAAACWLGYQEGAGDFSPVPFGLFWPEPPAGSRPAWVPTEAGEPVTVVYTWGIAVVAQDPARREAALLLARWLVDAKHMSEMAQSANLVPTRSSAIREWGLAVDETAFIDTLLSHGVPALLPSIDTLVRRGLQAGFVALLQREVQTPELAASTALTALRR